MSQSNRARISPLNSLQHQVSPSLSDPSSVPFEITPGQSAIMLEFTKIEFYIELDLLVKIEASYVEPLSQESFEGLISAYKLKQKNLIIAVIKNRDPDRSTVIHNFYFNAHLLNKLLFRMKSQDGEIISRHHREYPILVSNPMTNLPIIGEVEYFMVKDGDSSYVANFIGTDYTFVYNENLREAFKTSALKPEDADLPEFNSPITDFTRFLDLDINSLEILTRLVELQRDTLLAQIKVPFIQAFIYGILVLINLILIATVMTFSIQRVIFT